MPRKFGEFNDVSKFVNKAVITEQTAHFVPEHTFSDFKVEERLKENIAAKGIGASIAPIISGEKP